MAWFDLEAHRHICALQRKLEQYHYEPEPWRLRVVHDPKTRLIAAPSIRDRVLHRALIDEIGPYYERSFFEHSYTASAGRGPHRAVLCYQRWLRRFDYRLSLDIRRYFPSIHQPTLCDLLFRKLRCADTRALIEQLLQTGGEVYRTPEAQQILQLDRYPLAEDCGLPLGSYLSQWCGTFYLDGLDHFVKRELKIKGFLRYMDDTALFANSRAELIAARDYIGEWLECELRLQLNPKHWHVMPTTEAGIFLGYRVSRAGISPGRKLRRRLRQQVQRAARRGAEPLSRTLQSYRGLLLF
jgi:hypothetical protein